MSSQEESPVLETAVASTPVAVEAKPADTAPATETKSESVPSKEVLKPDLPRLPKPDRRDLDARVLALQEVADVQQARIEELKRAIETRKDARTKVGAGSSGAKTRIQELNTQFIQRMEERNVIRKDLLGLNAVQEKLREQANAMKQKLKFLTVEAVDREVARLEDAIAHTTMPLNEEKKMVTAIKDLGKSRETVREYQTSYSTLNGDDGTRKAVVDKLKAKDLEITALKVEQNELRGALTVTKKQEDKAGADIPGLNDERQACYEIIKAKRDEIRSLRDEHKKKEDEHFNRERLWRAFLKLEQQKKWESGLDERKAREAAKKAWDIENAPEPFELEVAAADQLVNYLGKWDAESDEAKLAAVAKAEEDKKKAEALVAAEEKAASSFAGMSLGGAGKKESGGSGLFGLSQGPVKGKKGKKFGKKPPTAASASNNSEPAAPEETAKKPKNEKLQIPFEAYGSFAKLGVDVPLMTGDVPSTIVALKHAKTKFLEKRRVKKERQLAGLEDDDEKKEKEAAAGAKKGNKSDKSRRGGKKGKNLVTVSLEVQDDVVTCVITVAEKSEK
jgi:hypothetical protein|mmetsp:Transcript_8144/g.30517  ORF Transcript_8144/g.30517 Transcript_8144/m.30517 type:complete len:563 (+) Transcript_8144:237-1925(+)